jgi:hypothetical protein
MADPTNLVEAPRRRPRKGGIKTVANVVENTGRMFASERLDWLEEGCTFPKAAPGLCWGEVVAAADKELDGIGNSFSGLTFAGYTGVECLDLDGAADFEARARRALEQGEDRFVEAKLIAMLAAADATPTAGTAWVAQIAAAEEAADANYLGLPIFVMSREDAAVAAAAGALVGDPDQPMYTRNGSPVLATSAAASGTFYVTGDITLWMGPVAATTATHPQQNTAMALAERAYALGIDCDYVVAYGVTIAP